MAFWIFQNVVITAALAAAVLLVSRSGRIGPVARHALWLIVLVKFITPPLVVWPWAAPDPFGVAAIDARTNRDQATVARVTLPDSLRPGVTNGADLRDVRDLTDPTNVAPDDRALAPGDAGDDWTTWALMLWVAGSAVLLGIEVIRLIRLARRISSGVVAPAESAIATRVTTLAARLGVRPVTVVIVPGGASPVVWGLARPMLLWPAELPGESSDACVDGLLVHELAHVKRRDHLIGWIELFAGVTWWWNPLFWFVRSARREQAELACDAWVISALPNGRRAYAESLLALSGAALGGASSMSSSMAAVGIHATSRRVLERRLVMIMKGRAPLRLPFAGIFCLALIGAATLPAWATSAQNPPPPPPPQAAPPAPPAAAARPETVAPARPVVVAPAAPAPSRNQSAPAAPVPARARTAVRDGVPVAVPVGVPAGVLVGVPAGAAVAASQAPAATAARRAAAAQGRRRADREGAVRELDRERAHARQSHRRRQAARRFVREGPRRD